MQSNEKQLKEYPEVMNKDQFRRACNVSPRTALFLFRSGLVPCHNNGKVTHCYSIKKSDVIAYLQDREKHPEKYSPSAYSVEQNRIVPKQQSLYELNAFISSPQFLKDYLSETYNDLADLLDVQAIAELTGYSKDTVKRWISSKKLPAFLAGRKYLIPKDVLLEWMSSADYNSMRQKSMKHISILLEASAKNNSDE